MAGALDGPEPTFGAPDPPAVAVCVGAGADAGRALDGCGRRRAWRFANGRGFGDAVGACTVTGGNAWVSACDTTALDCA
jgi:hypothetical protein